MTSSPLSDAAHGGPQTVERAVLRDGSVIHIRPIEPGDKELLQRGLERLGAESRYRRFLAPVKRLDRHQLAYFTEVDHADHEALLAVDPDHGDPVGVARYVRLPDQPGTAEVAMAVVDDWQGHGVATLLLHELVGRARSAHVTRFRAMCLADNRQAIEVLESLGDATIVHPDSGLAELTIALPADGSRGAAQTALRHAAAGSLQVHDGPQPSRPGGGNG